MTESIAAQQEVQLSQRNSVTAAHVYLHNIL